LAWLFLPPLTNTVKNSEIRRFFGQPQIEAADVVAVALRDTGLNPAAERQGNIVAVALRDTEMLGAECPT
jgi:hypothetical protein